MRSFGGPSASEALLLDSRNGEAFDLPELEPAPRTYLIASTPRTGSTLLARLLWGTGLVGAPKEYCNPMQLRDWSCRFGHPLPRAVASVLRGRAHGLAGVLARPRAIEEHLLRVRDRRSSGGWFGLKIHYHHFAAGWARLDDLERLLGPVTCVRIRRRDRVAQAISWERAHQSNRWVLEQRARRQPRYRRHAIEQRIRAIGAAEAKWDHLIGTRDCLEMDFDALRSDPAAQVQRVLAVLGVEYQTAPDVPRLGPIDPELALRWRERYESGR